MRDPKDELEQLRQAELFRQIDNVIAAQQDVRVPVGGREMLNFSSNDYLGLASCEELKAAFIGAVEKHGVGSGASRLICGTQAAHRELEEALASFLGKERSLVFATGFAAAGGVLGALLAKGDVVILDKLCHASLVDGARASGATARVFPHGNLEKLASHLRWARGQIDSGGRILVVTEAVFSMDGDRAPLAEIIDLKDAAGAWLLVDEAHSFGITGPGGRGLAHELGVAGRIDLHMATLGKSAGVAGGFVAASDAIISLVINRARSFIYSTAPPPAQAAAARRGIEILASARGDSLREQLWNNVRSFDPAAESAIVPWIVGDEAESMELARQLREGGFLVPAIRFPTVARGAARLRVTLSSAHRPEDVRALKRALAKKHTIRY